MSQQGYNCDLRMWQAPDNDDTDEDEDEDVENDESSEHGKAFVFSVCMHYILRSQTGHNYELDFSLDHPLHQFHGRSSYGTTQGRNSTLPNVPIGLSALIHSWGLNEHNSSSSSLEAYISNYMNNITLRDPRNSARKLIRMNIRFDIIVLQLDGEDIYHAIQQFVVNVTGWINGYMYNYNSEKDLSCVDQGLLHRNSISSNNRASVVEEEDCCCICLQDLQSGGGGGGSFLPCSHVYHYDCIVKWLWRSNLCPLCRTAYSRY